jgi:hypothetical protein
MSQMLVYICSIIVASTTSISFLHLYVHPNSLVLPWRMNCIGNLIVNMSEDTAVSVIVFPIRILTMRLCKTASVGSINCI